MARGYSSGWPAPSVSRATRTEPLPRLFRSNWRPNETRRHHWSRCGRLLPTNALQSANLAKSFDFRSTPTYPRPRPHFLAVREACGFGVRPLCPRRRKSGAAGQRSLTRGARVRPRIGMQIPTGIWDLQAHGSFINATALARSRHELYGRESTLVRQRRSYLRVTPASATV